MSSHRLTKSEKRGYTLVLALFIAASFVSLTNSEWNELGAFILIIIAVGVLPFALFGDLE